MLGLVCVRMFLLGLYAVMVGLGCDLGFTCLGWCLGCLIACLLLVYWLL